MAGCGRKSLDLSAAVNSTPDGDLTIGDRANELQPKPLSESFSGLSGEVAQTE